MADTDREPIPAWYSLAKLRNARRRAQADAGHVSQPCRAPGSDRRIAEAAPAVGPTEAPGGLGLTARGEAAVALIRFEHLFRGLAPEDRRWFADELGGLAEEARLAR